jgi:signal peptidase II
MIFIIALSILLLDQASKLLAVKNLSLNESIPLIKGVFYLTLISNRGAAFGLFKGQVLLFASISILAVVLIGQALRKNRLAGHSFHNIALSLILAGAVGNLIDRLRLGYVIDFLDFRVWPVFNVADSAITIGAVLLGWSILKTGNKEA